LITDENSQTYQTLAFAPYGELLVNVNNGSYDESYKFTGYERDQESGLDYAHARSKDVNLQFISTDPMWGKYPHLSPYAYCGNNPINRVDKDGEFWLQLGGAVLSGGIDYVGQVAGNITAGQSLGSALKDVSLGSIAISMVEGAINPVAGVSKAATKAVAKSVVKTVAKTTLKEAATSAAGKVLDNAIKGENLTEGVVREAVVGGVFGNAKIAPSSPKANQTIKELNAKLGKGKPLTNRQTERLVEAKAEKASNDGVKLLMDYTATAAKKSTNEIIQQTNENEN
jgi:RHS repeat-associated protein